jgi:hypothetical protein
MVREFPLKDDGDAVPPPPLQAPRLSELVVVVICAAVFGAEFAVAFGGVEAWRRLPFSASPVVRSETPSSAALDVTAGGNARRSLDPEGILIPLEAEPFSGPSSAPPARMTSVDDKANSTASTGAKVHRHRANAPHPARNANGGDRHPRSYRDQLALANEIYQPGNRGPGW